MKYKTLKRQLIKQSTIIGAIMVVFGGAVLAVDYYTAQSGEETKKLVASVNSTNNTTQSLQKQYDTAKASLELYNTLNQKRQNSGFSIDRDKGSQIIKDI